jgi:hypothetical protein
MIVIYGIRLEKICSIRIIMAVIDIYRRGITDKIKLIVFQTYFDKGYSTARSMAEYFKIPVTSAHYWIQEIKTDLKQLRDEN